MSATLSEFTLLLVTTLWSISATNFRYDHLTNDRLSLHKPNDLMKEITCVFDIENGAQICNCGYYTEEMYLPKMGGNTFQVNILNCKTIYIRKDTFSELSTIAKISFTNIENLILEPDSLLFPLRIPPSNRVQLDFLNTIIEELPSHAISGNVDVVTFEKCQIGIVRAFAITGLSEKAFRITLSNSVINRLEPQVFKKFSVDQLLIQNCQFISFIPSRAFYDLIINDLFSIVNSNLTGIFPGAFILKDVDTFTLKSNRIDTLDGSSFQMQIKRKITIDQNLFKSISSSAFESIVHSKDYFATHSEPMDLEFSSNIVNIMDQPPLLKFSTPFHVKLTKLLFLYPVKCSNITSANLKENQFITENSENIFFKIIDNFSDTTESIEYQSFSHISNKICVEKSYLWYIIIGVVVLIVIAILVFIVLVLMYLRKRKATKLDIIQPEGKTYRETQIIMQIENAGLLKTDL